MPHSTRRILHASIALFILIAGYAATAATLGDALNSTNWVWTTGGQAGWITQTSNTKDGLAVRSGQIGDGQRSWLTTTVQGPGIIKFSWGVSSESCCDPLEFSISGTYMRSIRGQVSWSSEAIEVPAGTQTLTWTYRKDGSVASGLDCGWIDQIEWDTNCDPAQIVSQPQSCTNSPGESASFSVTAQGAGTLRYQWRHNGVQIWSATDSTLNFSKAMPTDSGEYDVIVSNGFGSVTSVVATLTIITLPLADSLDETNLVWTTVPANSWYGQNANTTDGIDAAVTTAPPYSSLTTDIVGPARLDFAWMSESYYSYFLEIDGVNRASAFWYWNWNSIDLPFGSHKVSWRLTDWEGSAYLDQVSVSPLFGDAPTIITQPQDQSVPAFGTAKLTVAASGTPPLFYSWTQNGTNIAAATASTLLLTDIPGSSEISHVSVAVSNLFGVVTSATARITITNAIDLQQALDATQLVWTTPTNGSGWFGQARVSHDGADAAFSGTASGSWLQTTVAGPGQLQFWWKRDSRSGYTYPCGDFYIDRQYQTSESASPVWESKSFIVPYGNHTLKWVLERNWTGTLYLDQVSWTPLEGTAPSIIQQSLNQSVSPGEDVALSVQAEGTEPMFYTWYKNDFQLGTTTNGLLVFSNASPAIAGTYTVAVTNLFGSATSTPILVEFQTISLEESLDVTNQTVTTRNSNYYDTNGWFGQVGETHDGEDSACSPDMWQGWTRMETIVTGPALARFWRKCELREYEVFEVLVDEYVVKSIQGTNAEWQLQEIVIPDGSHSLAWMVRSTAWWYGTFGRAWVDELSFAPLEGTAPSIVTQPQSQTVPLGEDIQLSVIATGSPQVEYQWVKNGLAISGATSSTLDVFDVGPYQAGVYSVIVSNWFGTVVSTSAIVNVQGGIPLVEALDAPDLAWQAIVGGCHGETNVTHDGVDAVVFNSPYSYLFSAVRGPATVGFWWKSEGTYGSTLQVYSLDGYVSSAVLFSTNSHWRYETIFIPDGWHEIYWGVYPDGDTSETKRFWIDEVRVSPVVRQAPQITVQPTSQAVAFGSNVTLRVQVSSSTPVTYEWYRTGYGPIGVMDPTLTLTDFSEQHVGSYYVIAYNAFGQVMSATAQLYLRDTLSEAVEFEGSGWSTSCNTPWCVDTNVFQSGESSIRSGSIGVDDCSSISTIVEGPGTLSFWWKSSCATNIDSLDFMFYDMSSGTTRKESISGRTDWQYKTYTIPAGSHTIEWIYQRHSLTHVGKDCGWVDSIRFSRSGTPPVITVQPKDCNVYEGMPLRLSVKATGTNTLINWYQDDQFYAGGETCYFPGFWPGRTSVYATAMNDAGTIRSRTARINILPRVRSQLAMEGATVSLLARGYNNSLNSFQWSKEGYPLEECAHIRGSTNRSLTIRSVTSADSGWYTIYSANSAHNDSLQSSPASLLVLPQSQVVNWGGTIASPLFPKDAEIARIAAGDNYSIAVLTNGTVIGAGENSYGCLDIPQNLSNVIKVVAGPTHCLALLQNGTVVAWGNNELQQCAVPYGLNDVVSIAAGAAHSLALKRDGTVVAWGEDSYCQAEVPGLLTNVVAIAAANSHSLVLTKAGRVRGWGANSYGQLNAPSSLNDAIAIATGDGHSLALRRNGTVVGWGDNTYGQAQPPAGLTNVVAIAAGTWHSVALTRSGAVVAWGLDSSFGYPDTALVPIGLPRAAQICAGGGQTLVLTHAPYITTQPQSQDIIAGQSVQFSVEAFGKQTLRYQWRFNGNPIAGATNSVLNLASAGTNAAGTYRVLVQNAYGQQLSLPAYLGVSRPEATWISGSIISGYIGTAIGFVSRSSLSPMLSFADDGTSRRTPLSQQPPALQITRNGTNLVLSWPGAVSDYVLESSAGISEPFSTNQVGVVPLNDGTNNWVTLPVSTERNFFRLRKATQ